MAKGLGTKISLDGAAEFKKNIQDINSTLKVLGSELKLVSSEFGKTEKSADLYNKKNEVLNKEIDEQRKKVENLKNILALSAEQHGVNAEQTKYWQTQLNNAQTALNTMEREVVENNKALEDMEREVVENNKALEDMEREVVENKKALEDMEREVVENKKALEEFNKKNAEAEKQLKKNEENLKNFTEGFHKFALGVGTAITTAVGFATKIGIEYESAFAGVRKTVDATEEEFKQLSDGIRDMAKEVPMSAASIAELAESAGQLGIKKENILDFTRVVADLGVATNIVGQQGASDIAQFANIVGMSQNDFDRFGSSIVALGNNFATTEQNILSMAGRLAGAGAQVGMSEADILGLATALSSLGIEAEMGGSAFSKVIVNMGTAISTTDKFNQILAEADMSLRDMQLMASNNSKGFTALAESLGMTKSELNLLLKNETNLQDFAKAAGMTGEEFKTAFSENAVGALEQFILGLGNADEAGTSTIEMLQEFGITELRLSDSLRRTAGSSDLLSRAVALSNEAWEENVALANEAEQRYGTTESKLQLLKNAASDAGISFFDMIDDHIIGMIEGLADGLNWVSDNLDILVPAILTAITAIGGLALVFNMQKMIEGVTVAVKGFNLALASNPIGVVVVAVTALTVGLIGLIENFDEGLKKMEEVEKEVNKLADGTDRLVDSVNRNSEAYANTISNMEAEAQVATDLTGKILALVNTENKSAEQKKQLATYVDMLNTSMEGLNLQYDEETNLLNKSAGEIYSNIEARKEQIKTQAMQERAVEVAKEQLRLEEQLNIVREKKAELIANEPSGWNSGWKEMKKYNDSVKELTQKEAELTEQFEQAGETFDYLTETIVEDSLKQSEAVTESVDVQKDAMSELEDSFSDVKATQERILAERAEADEQYTLKLMEEANKQEMTLDEYKNYLKDIAKAEEEEYKRREDVLKGFTQAATDMYSQLSDKTELTVNEMTANLEHNQRVVEEWSNNIAKLAEKGIDEGLLASLENAGVSSAGAVKTLVNASDTELQKLSDVFANGSEVATQAMLKQLGLPEVTNAGSDMIDEIAGNAENNTSLNSALENIVTDAKKAADEQIEKSNFADIGKEMINGIIEGINNTASSLYKAISSVAKKTFETAKKDLQIQSPSKLFRDEIGKMIPDGMAEGITQNSKKVSDAAEKMSKMTYDNAKLWIEDYRNSSDYLISEEEAMWEALGEHYTKVSKEKIEIDKNINKLREQQLKEQEQIQKEFYDNAKLYINDYKNSVDYNISEEIKMWQTLGENYSELSKEKIEIDKTINKLRDDLRKEELAAENAAREESFNFSKNWIEAQKELGLLTMQEEIEGWERVSARYEEGTKQREEADKNLSKAREELRKAEADAIKEMEKLEEEYTKAVESRAAAIFNTFGLFSDVNLQETNVDKNTQKVKESQKAYNGIQAEIEKLTSKMQEAEIGSDKWREAQIQLLQKQEELRQANRNLTEATEIAAKSQAQVMTDNLTAQIGEMTKWKDNMQELSKKGLDEGLLEELRKMGPTANGYLEQLNISSGEELTKLSELYQEKHALARELAVEELKDLRRETDEQISNILYDLSSKMSSETNPIGQNMIQGIIDGLNSKSSELYNTMTKIANQAASAAKSALQIHSPSRVFAKIGSFTGEGFIDGIKSMAEKINSAVSNTFSGFDIDDISTSLNIRENLPSLVTAEAYNMPQSKSAAQPGGVTNHFHINGLTVREEADVERIARKLYNIEQREMRARGLL